MLEQRVKLSKSIEMPISSWTVLRNGALVHQ